MRSLLCAILIGAPVYFAGNLAAADEFCPRLEGINLKCMMPPPSTPPSGGLVCPISSRPYTCQYYASTGSVDVAHKGSVCSAWTCDVENSPEGIPRYRSLCTARTQCCDISPTTCYNGKSTGTGTISVNGDCSTTIDCPGGSANPGGGGPDCGSVQPTSCDGLPSCSGGVPEPPCGPS